MISTNTVAEIEALDEILADHPVFSNVDYLSGEFIESSRRRLDSIADTFEPAALLRNELDTAEAAILWVELTDTVVRNAIRHAQMRIISQSEDCMSLESCTTVLMGALDRIRAKATAGPYGSDVLARPSHEDFSKTVIWSEAYPATPHSIAYRHLIESNYGGGLATLEKKDYDNIDNALSLLNTLMPKLTRSALEHVRIIGVFDPGGTWATTASSSQIRLGGTIFIGRHLLEDPWCAAEHILHEALHQKLYDFRHTHTLLDPSYQEFGGPRVATPWNTEGGGRANSWDAHRVFAAFHVYVQLCVLGIAGRIRSEELSRRFGPPDKMLTEEKSFARAWFLGEQMKTALWNVLGEGGRALRDWMMDILNALDDAPPPVGSKTHLALVLMGRDTIKLRSEIDKGFPSSVRETINSIVNEEVETTRAVLKQCDATDLLAELDESLENQNKDDPQHVASKRQLAQNAIRSALIDGYVLSKNYSDDGSADDRICKMIVGTNRKFFEILEGIPRSVSEARLRATKIGFHASCTDEVGSLLATLAAQVPIGGRILEIGTGTGVGLAWMIDGLAERRDVKIVSLESDKGVFSAATDHRWPEFVKILHTGFLAQKDKLQRFDLVFADASPLKYDAISEVLEKVAEGGLLLIDDLDASQFQNAADIRASKVRSFKRSLQMNPDFIVATLSGGTGLVLATRVRAPSANQTMDDLDSLAVVGSH